MRIEPKLVPGRRYELDLFTATLIELTPDHEDVLRVRFDFRTPLAESDLLLLTWNGTAFQPLDYDELADGETRVLADTSDLLAAMMGH